MSEPQTITSVREGLRPETERGLRGAIGKLGHAIGGEVEVFALVKRDADAPAWDAIISAPGFADTLDNYRLVGRCIMSALGPPERRIIAQFVILQRDDAFVADLLRSIAFRVTRGTVELGGSSFGGIHVDRLMILHAGRILRTRKRRRRT